MEIYQVYRVEAACRYPQRCVNTFHFFQCFGHSQQAIAAAPVLAVKIRRKYTAKSLGTSCLVYRSSKVVRKNLKYVLHKKTCSLLKATRKEERDQISPQTNLISCLHSTVQLRWMDKADLRNIPMKNHSTSMSLLLSRGHQHPLKVVTFFIPLPPKGHQLTILHLRACSSLESQVSERHHPHHLIRCHLHQNSTTQFQLWIHLHPLLVTMSKQKRKLAGNERKDYSIY